MEQWIYCGIIAHLKVELTRSLEKSTIKGTMSEPEESEVEELDLQSGVTGFVTMKTPSILT